MDHSSYDAIRVEKTGRILRVTFNRPGTLNAFDAQLHQECERILNEAATDDDTGVIVLTGAGRAFSAGGNLHEIRSATERPSKFLSGMIAGKRLIYAILDCPKPIIAKVNGAAIGLGATIALFSDIIIAANNAKIADPHVQMGYVAGDGGAVIWPQLIGYARAKQFLFTGDALSGEEAARIGLINRAVPIEELDGVVDELAQRLATSPARAVQWTKLSVNVGLKQLAASVLEASIAYEGLSNHTEDHREALSAYEQKRAPKFSGQ
jgi:enoyl-CoA hydratase